MEVNVSIHGRKATHPRQNILNALRKYLLLECMDYILKRSAKSDCKKFICVKFSC